MCVGINTFIKQNELRHNYHECYSDHLINNWLSSQLNLTDHTNQESSDFKCPPLQAEHKHAGNGHLYEQTPFLHSPVTNLADPVKQVKKNVELN